MKRKILFTIHYLPIGGAEKVLCDILAKLDYSKFDVSLLLYNRAGELLSSVPKEVKILYLYDGAPKNSIAHRIIERIYHMVNLRKKIDRKKVRKIVDNHYDAIISFCHGHGHMMHSFIFDRSNNNISWIHSDLSVGNWGLPFFDNDIKKQEAAYNRMNTIIYVSNDAKLAFHKAFNVASSVKEKVIYNFVNANVVITKSSEKLKDNGRRKFTFINIGRLIEAKNQDRIIEASSKLRSEGYEFEFWIVGDGPLKKELSDLIFKFNLQDTVKLLGSQINPYKFLNASDCFVLTSHQEGFSIVIVEAFVLGKPVITMRSSGPSELVGDSQYGILIDQSIDDLVNAMKSIMMNQELRDHYSKMSLIRSKDFDGEKTMNEIEDLLYGK